MHAALKSPSGASSARSREHDAEGVRRCGRDGRIGQAPGSATTSGPRAYSLFSVGLLGVGLACLIVAATTGKAWLLAVAVGVSLLAAALATCA